MLPVLPLQESIMEDKCGCKESEKSIQQSVIEDQLECRKQDKSYNDNVSTQESSIEDKFVCKEAEKCLSDGLTIQQSVTEDQLDCRKQVKILCSTLPIDQSVIDEQLVCREDENSLIGDLPTQQNMMEDKFSFDNEPTLQSVTVSLMLPDLPPQQKIMDKFGCQETKKSLRDNEPIQQNVTEDQFDCKEQEKRFNDSDHDETREKNVIKEKFVCKENMGLLTQKSVAEDQFDCRKQEKSINDNELIQEIMVGDKFVCKEDEKSLCDGLLTQKSVTEDQFDCRKQEKSFNDSELIQESIMEDKFACKEDEKSLCDGLLTQNSMAEEQFNCRKQEKSFNENEPMQETIIEDKYSCKEAEKSLCDGILTQKSVAEDQFDCRKQKNSINNNELVHESIVEDKIACKGDGTSLNEILAALEVTIKDTFYCTEAGKTSTNDALTQSSIEFKSGMLEREICWAQDNLKHKYDLAGAQKTLKCGDSHVHFASPLSVCHEYSVSLCSSRSETQESGNDAGINSENNDVESICSVRDLEGIDKIGENVIEISNDHNESIGTRHQINNQGKAMFSMNSHISEYVDLSAAVSTDENIIEVVGDIVENLVVKCCDNIQDSNTSHDKIRSDTNVLLTKIPLDQIEMNVKFPLEYTNEVESFSSSFGKEIQEVNVDQDFITNNVDDSDIVPFITLKSTKTDPNFGESFSNYHKFPMESSIFNMSMVESDEEVNMTVSSSSPDVNDICLLQDSVNVSSISEDYNSKVQTLQERIREKIEHIMSPTSINNNEHTMNSTDEDGVNNCNDFSTAVNFDSQESSKEESNLEFQIFDSEEESIESETEITNSSFQVKIINCTDNYNEEPENSNTHQYIYENIDTSSESQTRNVTANLENEAGFPSEPGNPEVDFIQNMRGNDMIKQETNITSLNLEHEQSVHLNDFVNDNLIGHLKQTQTCLPEIHIDSLNKRSFSVLNVSGDDITSANRESVFDLKTNCLDKNQESNSDIQEVNSYSFNPSNSGNHLQEFNLSYERNESELVKKQLVAENVHSEIDCEDAKLQMQQTTCIYQEPSVKEEKLIKANELQLSLNNQQNNITNGRSERKRSIEKANVEDEPLSKVLFIEKGCQYKCSDVPLLDEEGIIPETEQYKDGNYQIEEVKGRLSDQQADKPEETFSFVEEMDQTVPVSSDVTLLDENHDDKDSETFYTETGTINNYVFSNMV